MNLFKNVFKKQSSPDTLVSNFEPNPDELVLQIHNEVDSLEEQSIKAVNELLDSINIPSGNHQVTNKADLMSSLGFSKLNETVIQGEQIKQEIIESTHLKEITNSKLQLINEYRLAYPLDKIIPMSEFQKVLTKYNLIYAPSSTYIKDVPEKNLLEIKDSKDTKSAHKASEFKVLSGITLKWRGSGSSETFEKMLNKLDLSHIVLNQVAKEFTEYEMIRNSEYDDYMLHNKGMIVSESDKARAKYFYTTWVALSEERSDGYYVENYKKTGLSRKSTKLVYTDQTDTKKFICDELAKLLPYSSAHISSEISSYDTSSVNRGDLFIAAPKTHFNLENLTTRDGKEFYLKQKVQITQLKDPIAFRILKGVDNTNEEFVRIISKWGTSDDQSYLDPIVQNETQN